MEATTQRKPELMNAGEVREMLGVPRSRFYQLAKADRLPFPTLRVGHRFMFSRRAVEEVLNRRHPDTRDDVPESVTQLA